MTSLNHKRGRRHFHLLRTDSRNSQFEDLASQVVGEMRERLNAFRKEENTPVTQTDLARLLEIDRSSISKMLNSPTNLTLRRIADFAAAIDSTCYFRMVREPRSEIHREANDLHLTVRDDEERKGKRRGLTLDGILEEAREYIRDTATKSNLLSPGKIRNLFVENLNDIQSVQIPFSDVQKNYHGLCIHFRSRDDINSSHLFVVAQVTFFDGYSEIEWVLYDSYWNEHFRSRDLQQAAQLAIIVLGRGGFGYDR